MEADKCEHYNLCESTHGMPDWYRCGICDDCGEYVEED